MKFISKSYNKLNYANILKIYDIKVPLPGPNSNKENLFLF